MVLQACCRAALAGNFEIAMAFVVAMQVNIVACLSVTCEDCYGQFAGSFQVRLVGT